MKKWLIAVCSLAVAVASGTALADLSYTQGVGTTLFDFVCFTTKHCSAHVLIDSTGTEKGTASNPVITALTSGSSVALGSFATGAVAAGAYATGSLAFGAGVDGWNQTEGTKADVAWTVGSGSVIALLKAVASSEISDPCTSGTKINLPISSAVSSTLAVSGTSAKKIYACSLILTTTGAMAISFVEGTGSQCATANQAAVIGGLTPSLTGLSLSSLMMGNGKGSIAFTASSANGLCIYQSTTGSILAGNLTYVQQ